MFFGREKELAILEKFYHRKGFQLPIIYGHRRIGKTTLISEFLKDKPAIFFSAEEASDQLNLSKFTEFVVEYFENRKDSASFSDWRAAFHYIAENISEERLILVIDEFPYVAEANKSFSSTLQHMIDHVFKKTNLYLILCGSQISFMETEVLGAKSPLFGRRTTQLYIEPFDYYETSKFLKTNSEIEKIYFYATVGGTPHYLNQIDSNLSFEENMIELFFDQSGYLYDEPIMLLKQELREPAMYNSILLAIAGGKQTLSEIANKIGKSASDLTGYVDKLIHMRIVKKVFPFGENELKSRKGQYVLLDPLFSFYYQFVFSSKSAIELGVGREAFGKNVLPRFSDYIGKSIFETVIKQYLTRKNKQLELPFLATKIGTWWGQDKVERRQTDIDVLAVSESEKLMLLGEVKWRNQFDEVAELEKLLQKHRLFPNYHSIYYFFSKSCYSKKANQFANEKNITLVELSDLFI